MNITSKDTHRPMSLVPDLVSVGGKGQSMPPPSTLTASARVDSLIVSAGRGLFTSEEVDKAKKVLIELLDASVVVRGTDRTASGSPIYVEKPDNPIRLAAASRLIEFETGKAPQAIDVTTRGPVTKAPTTLETLEMLKRNPALAAKLFDHIVGAAKRVQESVPVETSVTQSESKPESESGGLAP